MTLFNNPVLYKTFMENQDIEQKWLYEEPPEDSDDSPEDDEDTDNDTESEFEEEDGEDDSLEGEDSEVEEEISEEYDSDEMETIRLEWLEQQEMEEDIEEEDIEEYEQQLLLEEELQKYYEENPGVGYDDDDDDDSLISIPAPISNLSDIGPLLYRVFDDESISVYTYAGFTAGINEMPTDPSEFSQMIESHADWRSRVMTPFISTTNSLRVANWQIALRDRPGIKVAIIDTSTLIGELDVQVWEILDVMDDFGIEPPGRCTRSTFVNEYICGLHIPDSAILSVCEPEMFVDVVEFYLP